MARQATCCSRVVACNRSVQMSTQLCSLTPGGGGGQKVCNEARFLVLASSNCVVRGTSACSTQDASK
eukprot:2838217-Amphidinium_carterae.1